MWRAVRSPIQPPVELLREGRQGDWGSVTEPQFGGQSWMENQDSALSARSQEMDRIFCAPFVISLGSLGTALLGYVALHLCKGPLAPNLGPGLLVYSAPTNCLITWFHFNVFIWPQAFGSSGHYNLQTDVRWRYGPQGKRGTAAWLFQASDLGENQ